MIAGFLSRPAEPTARRNPVGRGVRLELVGDRVAAGIVSDASGATARFDSPSGTLHLFRPADTAQPLYYTETSDGLWFSSDLDFLRRALDQAMTLAIEPTRQALRRQMILGPATAFDSVYRVPPGGSVRSSGGLWHPLSETVALPAPDEPIDDAAAIAAFGSALSEAIQFLPRDRPIGLLASDAVYSPVLLALLRERGFDPLVVSPSGHGPVGHADGSELSVEFSEREVWTRLPLIAAASDEPFLEPGTVEAWVLAEAARAQGCKLLISAVSAGALFDGSPRGAWWRRSRPPLEPAAGFGLFPGEPDEAEPAVTPVAADFAIGVVNAIARHGLEPATPFVSAPVAAFRQRLPDSFLRKRFVRGWIARSWLQRHGPPGMLSWPKLNTSSLPVPVALQWLEHRSVILAGLVAAQPGIRAICDADAVHRLFTRHPNPRRLRAAWGMLFFALWHRAHILGLPPERDVFDTLTAGGAD